MTFQGELMVNCRGAQMTLLCLEQPQNEPPVTAFFHAFVLARRSVFLARLTTVTQLAEITTEIK